MKSKYLIDPTTFQLPAIDARISAFVEEKGENPWGSTNCYIGIIYNGTRYRQLIAEGLTEWVACDHFLIDLGLKKLESAHGYDSLFELPADLV